MKMAQLDAPAEQAPGPTALHRTKNTLLKIALREVGMAVPDDLLNGPVALAVAYEDLAQTIKAVLDFSEGNEIFIVKGGVIGTSAVGSDRLEAISNLPPLDMLRAQLLGTITMPLTQLVGLRTSRPSGRAVIQAAEPRSVNGPGRYSQKGEAA